MKHGDARESGIWERMAGPSDKQLEMLFALAQRRPFDRLVPPCRSISGHGNPEGDHLVFSGPNWAADLSPRFCFFPFAFVDPPRVSRGLLLLAKVRSKIKQIGSQRDPRGLPKAPFGRIQPRSLATSFGRRKAAERLGKAATLGRLRVTQDPYFLRWGFVRRAGQASTFCWPLTCAS